MNTLLAALPDGERRRLGLHLKTGPVKVRETLHKNGQPIREVCCRWLLMTQDRVGVDEFALTHEFLATMPKTIFQRLLPWQSLGTSLATFHERGGDMPAPIMERMNDVSRKPE